MSLLVGEVANDAGIVSAVVPEFRRVVPVWPYGFNATVVA